MLSPYLIVDVEATCWKDDWKQKAESEIIEIGAVLFDPERKTVIDEFQSFVRPIRNPVLTAFCTELTTIIQRQVDSAPLFPEAIGALKKRILDKHTVMLASWGEYDKNQLKKDCMFHKIKYPFGKHHLNIKQMFADKKKGKHCGMKQALKMLHIPLAGTQHRGIDDVRNIAKIFAEII